MSNLRKLVVISFTCGLATALAVAVFVGPAQAEGVLSDSLLIYDPVGDVVPNSGTTAGWNVYLFEDQPEGVAGIAFSAVPVVAHAHTTTGLTDPNGALSDVIGLFSVGGAEPQLAFISDPEEGLFDLATLTLIPESGGPIDVTQYLSFDLQDAGYKAIFTSVEPVPLPAALPLFAGGLGFMGWLARRRRGQTAHA